MSATANLDAANLSVQPGQEARAPLLVRNTGTIVDQLTFEAVGPFASWISVEPPTVSLFPGAEETVQVVFRPPRSAAARAGMTPFAVKVVPRESPGDTVVEEGVIDVGAFIDAAAELIPRTARGSTRGRYQMAIDQRGNVPLNVELSGLDENNELRFTFRPPALSVGPGEAAFARFMVHPKHLFWLGSDRTHQFLAQVKAEGAPPLTAQGTFIQVQRIPKWAPKAAAALLAAIVLLGVLWFALIRPKIRSEAKAAAQKQVQTDVGAQLANGLAPLLRQLLTPSGAGGGGGGGGGGGTGTGTGTGTATPLLGGSSILPPGPVKDGRLTVTAPGIASFTAPNGQDFYVTDILLENPKADTGNLTVQRSGAPLFVLSLDNFRDLDYHFISPLVFKSGQKLEMNAACTSPDCTPGMYYVGYLLKSS